MNHGATPGTRRASRPPATGKAAALLATLMSLIVVTSPDGHGDFRHPGLQHSRADLHQIKQAVAAKEAPAQRSTAAVSENSQFTAFLTAQNNRPSPHSLPTHGSETNSRVCRGRIRADSINWNRRLTRCHRRRRSPLWLNDPGWRFVATKLLPVAAP